MKKAIMLCVLSVLINTNMFGMLIKATHKRFTTKHLQAQKLYTGFDYDKMALEYAQKTNNLETVLEKRVARLEEDVREVKLLLHMHKNTATAQETIDYPKTSQDQDRYSKSGKKE